MVPLLNYNYTRSTMMKKANKHIKELEKEYGYKLSICMIVRDEEKFLDNCLKSLKPLLDLNLAELIIVDTGSVDKTIDIAKKYTEKLYFKEWNNSFSDARNYSISLAKGEYIFIMDADQDMGKSEVDKLIKLFTSNKYKEFNTYSLVYKNFTNEELTNYTYFSLNLIFKNDGTFKYEGKVHNQPIYKQPVKNLEVYMNHYGYIMTEDIKEKKFKRTATLLKNELEKDPDNIYYIYQLSRSYEMHGDTKEAIIELEKYLSLIEKVKIDDSFKINFYHNAAVIYFNGKEYDKCIYYCEKMKLIDKELIDCYYLLGKCYFINGNIDEAVKSFKSYFNYLKIFKYEKYANTNELEVFSHGDKISVISELMRLKIKINQLEGIDEYIESLEENEEVYIIMISEILNIYINRNDMKLVNKTINKVKDKDENILLYYLISKILVNSKHINADTFIEGLDFRDEEKELIKKKIKLEKENGFKNLLDFINESSKLNKIIKVENCIYYLITTLNNSSIDEIKKSNCINEIVYIIKYLLTKSDMIINSYLIDKENLINLMYKYISIIENALIDTEKNDIEFLNKINDFNKFFNEKNVIKAISLLKDAAIIKTEFGSLIATIKDSLLSEYIERNDLIKNEDIIKIKENIIKLINNNMIKEALEVFNELEKFYNIKQDVELITIKATLKFYINELKEAENILEDGVKYYPKDLDLLYNLAYIYEKNNKKITALLIYSNILKIQNINLDEINDNINRLKKEIDII